LSNRVVPTCLVCSKGFESRPSLIKHLKKHTKEELIKVVKSWSTFINE